MKITMNKKEDDQITTVRVIGNLIPSGTTRYGVDYNEFITYFAVVDGKKVNLRFVDEDLTELDNLVINGLKVFDISFGKFNMLNSTRYQNAECGDIREVVVY